jgi:heme A synthase
MRPDSLQHVNRHLTPLAVLIVAPGLMVGPLGRTQALLGAELLAYAVLMNVLTVRLERFTQLRVVSNYVVNIVLVWLLHRYWPVVWLLLLLMAVGPALYQDRRDAVLTGIAIAGLLLAVHALTGARSPAAWADAGVKASAIVVFSTFVNGLRRLTEES